MEMNVGRVDATLRTLIAVLALAFSLALTDHLAASLALAVLAILMVGTALTGKCPAYTLLGISTCREERAPTSPPARPDVKTESPERPLAKVTK